jgi:hypothetical protein
MPYLPAIGGGLRPDRQRRIRLTEDPAVWGAASIAGGGAVGPPDVDEYLDPDELVAHTRAEGAMHVVAGRGDDQSEYPHDGGQRP